MAVEVGLIVLVGDRHGGERRVRLNWLSLVDNVDGTKGSPQGAIFPLSQILCVYTSPTCHIGSCVYYTFFGFGWRRHGYGIMASSYREVEATNYARTV